MTSVKQPPACPLQRKGALIVGQDKRDLRVFDGPLIDGIDDGLQIRPASGNQYRYSEHCRLLPLPAAVRCHPCLVHTLHSKDSRRHELISLSPGLAGLPLPDFQAVQMTSAHFCVLSSTDPMTYARSPARLTASIAASASFGSRASTMPMPILKVLYMIFPEISPSF